MSPGLLKVVQSLSFARDRTSELRDIPLADWLKLLALTDRSQLTLPLAVRGRHQVPAKVQERLAGNLRNNAIRHARTLDEYRQVTGALSREGIEFIVLKGLAQWPHYSDNPRHRPQYDLDLYCPSHAIEPAYQAIRSLGYEPFGQKGKIAIDHLPPLIRMTGWRPRGDYYDPELPLTVELHFRFWDRTTEQFSVQGADQMWERRVHRTVHGLSIPTLHPGDGFSYSTWHLVRHLVRGDARAYHVYELAHFLQRTADDDSFWLDWQARKSSTLVEAIAFRLAVDWFECRTHPVVERLLQSLPSSVQRWFELFAWSPLNALERPNKDELFLHWCLVERWPARLEITKRRLFPIRFNPIVVDAHVPAPDLRLRVKRRVFGAWFMARRAFRHMQALAPVMWNGVRWRRALAK